MDRERKSLSAGLERLPFLRSHLLPVKVALKPSSLDVLIMRLRLCNAEVFERLFAVLYVSESFVHCIFQVSRGANKCASESARVIRSRNTQQSTRSFMVRYRSRSR